MTTAPRAWATSCDGDAAESTPMDLAALGDHKQQCSAASGRLVALQCGAGRLLVFVATRLVTTAATVAGIAAALLMWW